MMQKKLLLIAMLVVGISTAANAANAKNLYLGGQLFKTDMNYSGGDYVLKTNSVDDKHFGGRLFMGYSFTDFIAAEMGYNYFGKVEFKHNLTGNKQDMLQQGIDFVGKVSMPFDYGFGGYAKAGLLWAHRDSLESRSGYFANRDSDAKITPVGGLGLTYAFNPTLTADLSWTGTMKNSNLPKMYIYGVGLTYKFHGADEIY